MGCGQLSQRVTAGAREDTPRRAPSRVTTWVSLRRCRAYRWRLNPRDAVAPCWERVLHLATRAHIAGFTVRCAGVVASTGDRLFRAVPERGTRRRH